MVQELKMSSTIKKDQDHQKFFNWKDWASLKKMETIKFFFVIIGFGLRNLKQDAKWNTFKHVLYHCHYFKMNATLASSPPPMIWKISMVDPIQLSIFSPHQTTIIHWWGALIIGKFVYDKLFYKHRCPFKLKIYLKICEKWNSLFIASKFSSFMKKKYFHENTGTYKIGEAPLT